jgi:hypothetical protein
MVLLEIDFGNGHDEWRRATAEFYYNNPQYFKNYRQMHSALLLSCLPDIGDSRYSYSLESDSFLKKTLTILLDIN